MLYPKPSVITRVGLTQFLLALTFVIWLVFFPELGENFAWPIVPIESARFIGASFALLGYYYWHQNSARPKPEEH